MLLTIMAIMTVVALAIGFIVGYVAHAIFSIGGY